jgi:hypothetical protein
VESTQGRLDSFVGSTGVSRFMGLPMKGIPAADWIREQAIVLIDGRPSRFVSAEAIQTYVTAITSELFQAALDNMGNPIPYALYYDEAQKSMTAQTAEMLDQVLKAGLRITVSHHHTNQWAFQEHPELVDSLQMNAKIKAYFDGIPLELVKQLVEEVFPHDVTNDLVKRELYRTVTDHVKEDVEEETYGWSDPLRHDGRARIVGLEFRVLQEICDALRPAEPDGTGFGGIVFPPGKGGEACPAVPAAARRVRPPIARRRVPLHRPVHGGLRAVAKSCRLGIVLRNHPPQFHFQVPCRRNSQERSSPFR